MTAPHDPDAPAGATHAGAPLDDARDAVDRRLALALDAADVGTFEMECATGRVTWNAAHHRLLGLAPGSFAGTYDAFVALVLPADRAPLQAATLRAMEAEARLRIEYRVRRADDGRERWLVGEGVVVRDAAGAPVCLTGIVRDITDARAAEREREARAERLAEALDGSREGVWEWDVAADALRFPPSFATLLDYALVEMPTDSAGWRAIVHPDDHAAMDAALAAHLEGRTAACEFEQRIRRRDGTHAWVLVRGRAGARDAAGRATRLVGTFLDVTDRRQREEAGRERTAQLDLALATARIGFWRWDVARDRAGYSDGMRGIARLTRDAAHDRAGFLAAVHPDDRGRVAAALDATLLGVAPYEVTFRVVAADGGVTWVESRGVTFRDAAGAPTHVVGVSRDVTAEREAADALHRALAEADRERRRLEVVLQTLPVGVVIADRAGRIVTMTDPLRRIWGIGPDVVPDYATLVGRWRDTGDAVRADEWPLQQALRTGRPYAREIAITRPDGSEAIVLSSAAPIADAAGAVTGAVTVVLDLTERAELETRLRQAQKMEAVGQLAGGVAHDFNNLLTVITGNLEFVRGDLPDDHPLLPDLDEIAGATERARALVRQLLAFSRKQRLAPRPLDLNGVVRDAERLLRRVIGEEIALETRLADGLPAVRADRGQLEQVLLNLAVNARDAMLTARHGRSAAGGTLAIHTALHDLDATTAAAHALAPGRHVALVVRDSGHGMDAATRARIFEPFFTTKEVGQGTGLGLATVFGIVAQSGGAVAVESAPGAGAAFTILLPVATDAHGAGHQTGEHEAAPRRDARGTVLLVEDEAPVRATVRRMLERDGWAVREAADGASAEAAWAEALADDASGAEGRPIVLVTDLRLPDVGGRVLAARLRAERPRLPVLFISGYADGGRWATPVAGEGWIEKPFTAEALLAALARLLAGGAGA